ncbi:MULTISPECIES: propionyl-CoA synthetase [unclassified Mesorhizobium]|uniref:propionyl-CoA synthetase n=2 Tax=Phyllobacteriaceae TaxID=69277 RepID=UPI001091D773|nr:MULTISPECIES: propionyl-CoA synthetase [unclassified Mesorhizobium]TGQ45492.1 propionyl-CoA synthetase [Mesorhizobium sp. M4B.F.Ca.ET.214.01.1.1]TGQ63121.1 propionyl-CoA synthetase [Mesorhizobium sp. M4B.F.Ca.ET.211.01.1.1]TGU40759.1 propionyl-CoA synthetase [Mesorhizobium sp. M4B.F.Ca.ET.150.01.1.1]
MASRYHEVYESWRRDPVRFWAEAAKEIDWYSPAERVFDAEAGVYGRWFTGATCNTCFNAIDRHVAGGRADQVALIHDSAITGTIRKYTYADLKREVVALASVLKNRGIGKGDRVIIYMPMVAEAAIAMLACSRIGAVHSVVFGGFASHELATRIDDAKPKLIISASCGLEPGRVVPYKPLLDKAIEMSRHKPDACLILQREQLRCELKDHYDIDYADAVARERAAGANVDCVPVLATDPLYIIYTSGTTGQPKGIVRDNGGHMVALKWTMENEFGVKPGEVFWAASDVGWVVGHSYIVYGPLLHGATSILFEGKPIGTPDAGTYWRVISQHGVVALFTAPTAFRAIKGQDPRGEFVPKYDLSKFRTLFLAGERADPETIKWAEQKLAVPVIDHWWQTETGSPMTINPAGLGLLPVKYGSPGVPMPGYDIRVLDDAGHEVARGTLGNVVVKLPLPAGCLPTLWNADGRFRQAYLEEFPGFYKTADAGMLDEDGYLYVMARTDDIINVAGHRLSTGAMEEVLAAHPDVAECAVIGIADAMKGQVPLGFVVLNAGVSRDTALIESEVVGLVRERIGPVAAFKTVVTIKRLPKTRSGKILRGTMQKIADKEEWTMPATIDDPVILDEITAALKGRGIGV